LVTTVGELINPVTGTWDEDLITSIFWSVDANRILQIPLAQGREDVVAWHFNRNGYFSVGSAYHTQWLHKFGENNLIQQAGWSGGETVWTKLWKMNVPVKIKIFGWRILHGLLPCRGVLANKHIGEESSCPVCRQGGEDIKHVLFSCERAKEIWRLMGILEEINRLINTNRSGSVLMADIVKTSKNVKHLNQVGLAELILTGGWYIWWERRKLVHGDTVQNPARAALSIATLTTNYQKAENKSSKVRVRWKKPPEDFLCLNVDASYNIERSTGSSGAVIRDARGSFIAAAAKYYEHVFDAHMAEAMALREGLTLAQQVGCSRLLIQSDCAEVVETIKQGGLSATASVPIYDECAQLWQEFVSISIEHCNREANSVADKIARMTMESKLSCNWVNEPPSDILEALVNDVMMFQDQ
jgi:ribonuclease HI